MNLRVKTLIVIALGYSLTIIIFILYASFFLQSQLQTLEEDYVIRESSDFSRHVEANLQYMNRILLGYSGWNDTYQYVQHANEEYIKTNFQPSYLAANGISGVAILSRSGDLIYDLVQSPDGGEISPLSPDQVSDLAEITKKYDLLAQTTGVQGITSIGEYDALVASEPVLTDSYTGPAQGSMHYILWLDSSYLKQASKSPDQQVWYRKIGFPFGDNPGREPGISVGPHNETVNQGLVTIPSLLGTEQYQFILPLDRSFYSSSMSNIQIIILFLVFSGICIGGTVLIFIDRAVLSRVSAISQKINHIWNGSEQNQSVKKHFLSEGKDELEILYQAIEPVFDRINLAQHELKDSEDFFHQVADTIRDGVLIFETRSLDGNLVYCNPRSLEILGGSCSYRDIPEFLSSVSPEEQDRVQREWNLLSHSEEPTGRMEFWIQRCSGERRYILARFSRMECAHDAERILVVISDITERKTAEEALRESEANYRFMTENVSDVHWRMAPDLTFTYISPADALLRGFSPDEVVGHKVWEFIPLHAREGFRSLITPRNDCHKAGHRLESITFELEWLNKDGSIMWIEVVSNPVYRYDGILSGFHGIYRDITLRKIAEGAMKQANKKLNLLSSITRHDVLNQMTVIISTLELMKDEDVSPFIKSLLETEEAAASKVIKLIQFARDYQDIGLTSPRWFEVRDLVGRAVSTIASPDVTVSIMVGSLSVFADALLEKVFFNLIDNSIRHGKTVTSIVIDGFQGEECYHLIFSDNGAGVPPEEHGDIFTRGYGKNTGMGLFLIREILSITGISIEENGLPGKGARFEMVIPEGRFRIETDELKKP